MCTVNYSDSKFVFFKVQTLKINEQSNKLQYQILLLRFSFPLLVKNWRSRRNPGIAGTIFFHLNTSSWVRNVRP